MPCRMDLFVLLGIIVAVVGVALAAYVRTGRSTGGIQDRPEARPDHPDADAPRAAFEQMTDQRGTR